jgi:pyrimidine operon attenuation protein/uracil phosphoribosyltransferase
MLQDKVQKNCILTPEIIKRKLRRIALQIAEENAGENALLIAGINGNGEVLANKLAEELQQLLNIRIEKTTIFLNKREPIEVSIQSGADFESKVIIVVDDVSNTGRTLLFALKPFLQSIPKKIQTAVLVERSHKLYAVQPDYVGLSVSTTLQEHISVETEGDAILGAWLH